MEIVSYCKNGRKTLKRTDLKRTDSPLSFQIHAGKYRQSVATGKHRRQSSANTVLPL